LYNFREKRARIKNEIKGGESGKNRKFGYPIFRGATQISTENLRSQIGLNQSFAGGANSLSSFFIGGYEIFDQGNTLLQVNPLDLVIFPRRVFGGILRSREVWEKF